ncbi:hypothetical protein IWX90DRAFT_420 [Phyllosticta citrichinensis]|uniref:Uncharacterized protein n=1 Tax=Phyllosticta citrichinensis TaxID=1130410 RepID=A0ABR1Y564_9PEZI
MRYLASFGHTLAIPPTILWAENLGTFFVAWTGMLYDEKDSFPKALFNILFAYASKGPPHLIRDPDYKWLLGEIEGLRDSIVEFGANHKDQLRTCKEGKEGSSISFQDQDYTLYLRDECWRCPKCRAVNKLEEPARDVEISGERKRLEVVRRTTWWKVLRSSKKKPKSQFHCVFLSIRNGGFVRWRGTALPIEEPQGSQLGRVCPPRLNLPDCHRRDMQRSAVISLQKIRNTGTPSGCAIENTSKAESLPLHSDVVPGQGDGAQKRGGESGIADSQSRKFPIAQNNRR